MGYDLQITRKESTFDKGPDITVEEWLAVVESDPELTHDAVHHPNYPYHADWSGPGKYPCWLDYSPATLYSASRLYSKKPTEEMIDKMVQIAKSLGAKVLGEEDEEYLGNRWVSVLDMDMTTGELMGRKVYRGQERR